MIINRKFVYSSIIVYLLLTFYAIYFKYFPIIISSFISNILIVGIIIIILGILVFESFQLNNIYELYIILPQYLLFVFITRALPTLRFAYQPLSDPYYYFITTLNVTIYGTLQPVLSWWYGLLLQQLAWPNLPLIGSFLMITTNIQSIDLLRYLGPITGIIFFLGVFLLSKEITNNDTIALIAGLFASTGDTVLFYQSEYHPQGLAFMYFIFLLYFFILSITKPNFTNVLMLIITSITFGFSHHFSNLFIILFLIIYIILYSFLKLIVLNISNQNLNIKLYKKLIYVIIFIIIIAIFNHIFNYPQFIKLIKSVLVNGEATPTGSFITLGKNIPISVTVLNSFKYLLLFLALISIIYMIYHFNFKEFICSIAFLSIVLLGVVGTFISFIPVDRLIGFYIPFAALFAALTLYRFYTIWFLKWNKTNKELFILLIAVSILLAGTLNFFAPGLIFHDSPQNPYYWHSNDFSYFQSFGVPGNWIQAHVSSESSFSSYNGTEMIPYFYGKMSIKNIQKESYQIYPVKEMTLKTVKSAQIYTSGRFGIGIAGD